MNLRGRNKVNPNFNMSSMTDIVFLLLIFFMLTASFITPSGLPVNLPTSKSSEIVMQKVSVTITENLSYFVNNKKVSRSALSNELQNNLGNEEGIVVLHCDASVPVEHLVEVAGIATSLNAKVSIATKPE